MTDEQLARLMRFQLAVADAIDVRLSLLIPAGATADKCDDIVRDKFNLAKAMIDELAPAQPSTVWILVHRIDARFLGRNAASQIVWCVNVDDPHVAHFPSRAEAEKCAHAINLWKLLEVCEYQPGTVHTHTPTTA